MDKASDQSSGTSKQCQGFANRKKSCQHHLAMINLLILLKGKLGEIFLLAQSFYLTLTDSYSSFWPFGSYLVYFGPFNLIFDQLRGFSVKIAY